MRRLSRRTLLWAGLGVVVPACLSPTLPLPPPDAPEVMDLGSGSFRLTGRLPIYASVLIRNQRTHKGILDGPFYQYDEIIEAQGGDTLILWYRTDDGDESSPVSFELDRITPTVVDAGHVDAGQ